MPVETTVLFVDAASLPETLEDKLSELEVFVEHSTIAEVAQMVPVVVPELLIASADSDLDATIMALDSLSVAPPLVVLASSTTVNGKTRKRIQALLSAKLPLEHIAKKIAAMAVRSSEGKAIDRTTNPPPGTSRKSTPPPSPLRSSKAPSPLRSSKAPSPLRSSKAPSPLAPLQSIRIVDAETGEEASPPTDVHHDEQEEDLETAAYQAAARRKADAEAESHARKEAEERKKARAEKRKADAERRKKELAEKQKADAERRKKELAEKRKADAARRKKELAEKQKADAERRKKELTEKQKADAQEETLAQPKVAEDAGVQQKKVSLSGSRIPKPPAGLKSSPPPPVEKRQQQHSAPPKSSVPVVIPQAPELDEELSIVMALPVNAHEFLSHVPKSLRKLRLAFLDTDLTRADAISAALRDMDVKVHPLTPNPSTTRWPLLRRFSPQGLLVDEKAMARAAAEWVETFRGDPFLRHVPIILVRFSQLFRESEASIHLESLLPLVEPLGKEEFALLDKLKPGHKIDLQLHQIAPYRLIELLTAEDRNTRLDCRGDDNRLVWPLGPGYAGTAKLLGLEGEKVHAKISPQEALSWLLEQEDCTVSVQEHTETLAHASESEDARLLLNRMTTQVGRPARHQSVAPAPSDESSNEAVPLGDLALVETTHHSTNSGNAPVPSVPPPAPLAPPAPSTFPNAVPAQAPYAAAAIIERCKNYWASYQDTISHWSAPLTEKIGGRFVLLISLLPPICALVIAAVLWSVMTGDPKQPEASPEEDSKSGAQQGPVQQNEETRAAAKSDANGKAEPNSAHAPIEDKEELDKKLWKVAPDSALESCESKIGPSTPKHRSTTRSLSYWKSARRRLMAGKSAEAMELMCLAGLYDKRGPAAEGLAEYYLSERSLREAEKWIRLSLDADASRRKSLELLGDIESQKGNPDEALRLWLKTMQLSGDETHKLQVISKKLAKEAQQARRGGDLARSERIMRRAVALSPTDSNLAVEFGDILLQRKAVDAAERWATRARKLNPDNSGAMLFSGRVAEALGKTKEAADFYERIPAGDPRHGRAQTRLNRL